MITRRSLGFIGGLLLCLLALLLLTRQAPEPPTAALRVACNDDAAGLLIRYIAAQEGVSLQAVDMSYQQLQDCCSSQTELALSSGRIDMAALCPDAADKLLASGQPYVLLGPLVQQSYVLVTHAEQRPQTVGYMNLREIQADLVKNHYGPAVELQPMLPAGLPYALERRAVDGVVLDILAALKIGGYRHPLYTERPSSVLVVHERLPGSPELDDFILACNQATEQLNDFEQLAAVLAEYLQIETATEEAHSWQNLGVSYQALNHYPRPTKN